MSYSEYPTQSYPTLPPGNGSGPLPVHPGAYMPQYPVPYGAIPVAPNSRGAGFWIGITAAVSTGIVLALLAGFFIGRGSRLSNADVQSKITQQAQADQIVQQGALAKQKEVDQNVQAAAVKQATKQGEQAGLKQGQIQGYQQGQAAGYSQGQSAGYGAGQSAGYSQGQSAGYSQGQSNGFSQGYSSGLCSSYNLVC